MYISQIEWIWILRSFTYCHVMIYSCCQVAKINRVWSRLYQLRTPQRSIASDESSAMQPHVLSDMYLLERIVSLAQQYRCALMVPDWQLSLHSINSVTAQITPASAPRPCRQLFALTSDKTYTNTISQHDCYRVTPTVKHNGSSQILGLHICFSL